jgi:signal transduction histidine kinase/ligand-binding sensor domain-containing protein
MMTGQASSQLDPINLVSYDESKGSIIYDVMPDKMGNIWLATQNGLVKFNGYEFRRYYHDPNDSTTIGSILTFRLFEDRNGNIWIGCLDNLSVYNPRDKVFKSYPFLHLTGFPETSQTGISAIAADTAGRIYFGVTSFIGVISNKSILYYDEKEDRLRLYEDEGSQEVQNIYCATPDPFGNIWLISHNGFYKIDSEHQLHKVALPKDMIPGAVSFYSWIRSDNDGGIWMTADQARIFKYDPGSGTYDLFRADVLLEDQTRQAIFNDIIIDSANNIWMGTTQGLVFFDRSKGKFEMFKSNTENSLGNSDMYCLRFDTFNNLWIGTHFNGLIKYDNKSVLNSFSSYSDVKTSLTPGWAYRIYESSDGKIWIATIGGVGQTGINEFDPKTESIQPHPFESIFPGFQGFTAFVERRPGEFLVSTGSEFYIYHTRTNVVQKTTLEGFPDSVYIFNFCRDSKENLWFCTNNSLYLKSKGERGFRHIDLGIVAGSAASSKEVINVFEGAENTLWILTNNGLFSYDGSSGNVKRHGFDQALEDVFMSQDINSFYQGTDGICWVGTWQGGLSRYNPETGEIKTYTASDGLPSMSIQGILADEANKELWLSTFEGLSRFSIDQEEFNNFSLQDGIHGLLFADGSYLKTSDGLFIFGGNNGITVFRPDQIEKNSIPPKVYITDFKVADKSVIFGPDQIQEIVPDTDKEIILKHRQNNVSFNYIGIHYSNPSRNQFAYKLENYDDDWREVGNIRTAYYYNLPPGRYTFLVKSSNSNGIWNEEEAKMSFRIIPPWYKTWLAYSIYGLILLALVYSSDRYHRRRVLMKERNLAKELELAHAREIEQAYRELKTTQTQLVHAEKMASLGELAAGIAHEIQNPLNFVNNFSEVGVDLVEEMDDEIREENLDAVKSISQDIKQNLQKISHHGKRASAIVKGMLEHSRTSTGVKELTDINALADEYLRLAYHGLKAKDKTFNATYRVDLDPSLQPVNAVPQDMGRVLLNLINNAFYAVSVKSRQAVDGFVPTVEVSTKKIVDKVEIRVKDNGDGIPANVVEKIFQPFFTTKPTGQGTGLGLSLSFDIITQGHGGELKVETIEGEGTEFIIKIPG